MEQPTSMPAPLILVYVYMIGFCVEDWKVSVWGFNEYACIVKRIRPYFSRFFPYVCCTVLPL